QLADLVDCLIALRRGQPDRDRRRAEGARRGNHPADPSLEIDWPLVSRWTSRSEALLLRKFLKVRTTACGADLRARSARPSCAITTSVSGGISLTRAWITVTG